MPTKKSIKEFQVAIREFGDRRNWGKFHSPKNIAMALAVEASELLEIFQWQTEEESRSLDQEALEKAAFELADIFMYTLLASERLGIDLEHYTNKKLEINEERFAIKDLKEC